MQTVLITGASRGIGASAALHCARRGLGVVLTYKDNRASAEALVERIGTEGGQAICLRLDVSDTVSFAAFQARLKSALHAKWQSDRLHGLVNNAGFGLFEPIASVSEDQFDALFKVHLKGPFFLTQTLLPQLAPGAAIINLTSATTRVATPGVAPYAAFKGALEVLTRYMAREFGAQGIRANAVSPGAIRTELGGGLTPEFETNLANQTALGRVGEPDDVGEVIATLLSHESRWINAQSIEVGGGYMI
jgi:NAD(P)-dependent dehydrogenase (short-subunit alcohol dehydrogenase family)